MKLGDDPKIKAVVAALEDSRFKWRTVGGVAKQAHLTEKEVLDTLAVLISAGVVMRSSIPSVNGKDLFTTRTHYKRFTPLAQRLAAAFRNRAD